MSGTVGDQIVCDEWLGMVHVGIEREDQSRALLDKPNAGMAAAVNPPFMAFRLAEPAFQIQIVFGQVRDGAYEQPGHEADHQLHEVLRDRLPLPGESPLKLAKLAAPLLQRPLGGVERVGNRLNLLDVLADLRLSVGDEVQPTVDARRQPLQVLLGGPPFFAPTQRSSD